jgi:hypothetical protein
MFIDLTGEGVEGDVFQNWLVNTDALQISIVEINITIKNYLVSTAGVVGQMNSVRATRLRKLWLAIAAKVLLPRTFSYAPEGYHLDECPALLMLLLILVLDLLPTKFRS